MKKKICIFIANGNNYEIRGCTFGNTTCALPVKQYNTVTDKNCKFCDTDLCNGAGANVINISALFFTLVFGVLFKSVMN